MSPTMPLAFSGDGPPALFPVAAELYRSLLPLAWADADNGYPLAALCAAIGSMRQDLDDLVRDSDAGPGWSALLDVDRAPSNALPWLGQFVGVTVDTTRDDPGQRAMIRDEAGFRRGTPASIVSAAQSTLTGMKSVLMVERDTSAYHLKIRTYDVETPDPAATLAAILTQKPAGIVLDYDTVSTWTWETLRDAFATWQDVSDYYADWQHVKDDNPTHP